MKTNVYIDSFNLSYGCLKGTPYKWLNILALCRLHFPKNVFNKIRFFTAKVQARPGDPQQPERQSTYIRALETLPGLSVHYGHYLVSDSSMPLVFPIPPDANIRLITQPPAGSLRVLVRKTDEKGSDVNIACHMLMDAVNDDYDAAVLISNDSDLEEPIRMIRQSFKKKVVVLHPCSAGHTRKSITLSKVASKSALINDQYLASSQFPVRIADQNARIITKPASW